MRVPLGHPLTKLALNYEVFYKKKPFPKTDLYLYDNGTYWIKSAGEDHYGVFVVTNGSLADAQFEITFVSFPSADWDGAAAYHRLQFDAVAGTFTQDAVAVRDSRIPPQNGTYRMDNNPGVA